MRITFAGPTALLALLTACSPSPPAARDGSSSHSVDAGPGDAAVADAPHLDTGSLEQLPVDATGPGDAAVADVSSVERASLDGSSGVADCSAIAASWSLCASGVGSCQAVFSDGTGCQALCAAAGMTCAEVLEDMAGQCTSDLSRPALSCDPATGHQSDYCVCVDAVACLPRCQGRSCGPDGCGGRCGDCPTGTCVDGTCHTGPIEDCTHYPYSADVLIAERVGFGRHTTGGDPARVYHVTTLAGSGAGSLRTALESDQPYWIVFDVEGVITHSSEVVVHSNKTVDGRGRDVTVRGAWRLQHVHNIILSDLKLENDLEGHCTQAGDVLLIRGSGASDPDAYTARDIWLHHLEAYNGGDGLIDIRGGSRITLSWNHLHTHKKAMLCWQTADDLPAPGMRVTFHHNFLDRLSLRGPQFMYGWAHFFNNVHYEWYEYGAASLGDAQFLSERNVYQARPGSICLSPCPDPNPCGDSDFSVSKKALVTFWTEGNGDGTARSVEDLALEGAEISVRNPDSVFVASDHYSYLAEPADEALKQRVMLGAGPRVDYCR